MAYMLRLLLGRIFRSGSSVGTCANGQHRYSGPYYGGKAVYYYDISGDRRVYEGKFIFSRAYRNYLVGKTVERAEGAFAGDKKDGRWLFTKSSKGEWKRLEANFSKGMYHGDYVFRSVHKSGPFNLNKYVTTMSLSMRNGLPVGRIEVHFGKEIFDGYFDEEGRPDGKWTLDLSQTRSYRVEYEVWSHGTLEDSYSIKMSTGTKIKGQINLLEIVMNFIYNRCWPLENIVKKGSVAWNGDIKCGK